MHNEEPSRATREIVEFETPENIVVRYRLAGVGTRFAAWAYDLLLLYAPLFLLIIVFASAGGAEGPDAMVLLGLIILALGVAPTAYFCLFELFWSGQTPGKRSLGIRVVSAGGFTLTATAVMLRTIFRFIDSIPLLWVVPLVTRRCQRLGDIVAGTVVVDEKPSRSSEFQAALLDQCRDRQFRFIRAQLDALDARDLDAVGEYLERRPSLPAPQAEQLAARMAAALAVRLECDPPNPEECARFLQELYAAHLEGQFRELA